MGRKAWFGNCSAKGPQEITELWTKRSPSRRNYTSRCLGEAVNITKEHSLSSFSLIPSGKRFTSLKSCTTDSRSFTPTVIRRLSGPLILQGYIPEYSIILIGAFAFFKIFFYHILLSFLLLYFHKQPTKQIVHCMTIENQYPADL